MVTFLRNIRLNLTDVIDCFLFAFTEFLWGAENWMFSKGLYIKYIGGGGGVGEGFSRDQEIF